MECKIEEQAKALAIHRVIKCGISIRPGFTSESGMEANSETFERWQWGDDLLQAITRAFTIWESHWRVQRERDILEATALDLDPTDVSSKPSPEYYIVPRGMKSDYASVYDIIQEYRCSVTQFRDLEQSGAYPWPGNVRESASFPILFGEKPPPAVVGRVDLIKQAFSFKKRMEDIRDLRREQLAHKLGIN